MPHVGGGRSVGFKGEWTVCQLGLRRQKTPYKNRSKKPLMAPKIVGWHGAQNWLCNAIQSKTMQSRMISTGLNKSDMIKLIENLEACWTAGRAMMVKFISRWWLRKGWVRLALGQGCGSDHQHTRRQLPTPLIYFFFFQIGNQESCFGLKRSLLYEIIDSAPQNFSCLGRIRSLLGRLRDSQKERFHNQQHHWSKVIIAFANLRTLLIRTWSMIHFLFSWIGQHNYSQYAAGVTRWLSLAP